MSKVRVELHFTQEEADTLNEMAELKERKRKNFCENVLRDAIKKFKNQTNKKIKK